jgi:hypothetical protein
MEDEDKQNKMIELSVKMDDQRNYNIAIPSIITSKNFQEILRRVKLIIAMIPKRNLYPPKKGRISPLLLLGIDETKEVIENYEKLPKDEFESFLLREYDVKYEKWENLISLIGRIKVKLKKMEEANENQ